jgi:4-hydroxybenzoate polyprenyltransferase
LLLGTSLAISISILNYEYLGHFLIPGIVAGIYIAFNLLQNKFIRDNIPSGLLQSIQVLLIKRHKWIKPISIALVWAAITTPPQIEYNSYDLLIFGSHTLLIFAIALFFDLKDIDRDRDLGIHTLAASWGATSTKWIVTLIFFMAYSLYYFVNPSVFWVLAYLLTIALIWQYPVSNIRREFYFYFAVDGLILIPWLVHELI